MINSAYGKTMKNLQKRINVRIINNEKDFLKYASRPTHITHKIFNKDCAAIHEIKPVLTLNKPIYVGFTVLDLSKWKMYDFYYNFMKKNFDPKGVNIAIEFSEFKDVLFNKKIIRQKIKRI